MRYKKKNHFRCIFILVLVVLSTSVVLLCQKNNYGKYPGDKPIPNIKEYPPAIQRLDSIKAIHHKQRKELQNQGQEYSYSDKFIKEYASAYISTYLFHTKPMEFFIRKIGSCPW